MKRYRKRIFVFLMVFCMMFTMVPSMAFAEEVETERPALAAVQDDKETSAEKTDTSDPLQAETAEEQTPTKDQTEEPAKDQTEEPAKDQKETPTKDQTEKQTENQAEETAEGVELVIEEPAQKKMVPLLKSAPVLRAGNSINFQSYVQAGCRQFWSTGGEGYVGTCCQPGVPGDSSGSATMSQYSNTSLTAKLAYQYGYKLNWIRSYAVLDGFQDLTNAARFMYMIQISQVGVNQWNRWAAENNFSQRVRDNVIACYNSAVSAVASLNVPDGFECYICYPASGNQNFILYRYVEPPKAGYAKVVKTSGAPGAISSLSGYTLAGAEYQVYTNADCTTKASTVSGSNALFTTNASGESQVLELNVGNYWLKETTNPKGYAISQTKTAFSVTTSNTTQAGAVVINVKDTPVYGRPNLRIFKTDKTGKFDWDDMGSAKFVVKYYDVTSKANIASATPKRTWTFTTSKKAAPENAPSGTYWSGFDWRTDTPDSGSDDFYVDASENRVIPIGWFTIEEVTPPSGFMLTDEVFYGHVYQNSSGAAVTDLEGADSDGRLNMETFIFRDEQYKTTVHKTNASGAELAGAKLQILQGSTVKVNTWTTTTTAKEVEGLLPGSYVLREVSAPAGYDIADDKTFTVKGNGPTEVSMKNTPVTIKTTAKSASTGTQTGIRQSSEKITDTIHLTGLVSGRKYKVTGKLMNKRTNAAVPNVTVSPKEFTATAATMDVTMDFTFDSTSLADGDSVVVFETLYRTSAVHSSETIPSGGKELVKHEDINDTNQTVKYPAIPVTIKKTNKSTGNALSGAKLQILQGSKVVAEWTTDGSDHVIKTLVPGDYVLREVSAPYGYDLANDKSFSFDGINAKTVTMENTPVTVKTTAVSAATGKHVGARKSSEKITDTVHMTGLVSGRKYKLTGQLMNKRTGSAISGATASKEFTATAATMDVEMDITFDSTTLSGGDSVVVYETLYRTSKVHSETVPVEIQKHQNINDAAQTVIYPGISTTAVDKASGTKNMLAAKNAVIKDTVTYKGLLVGETYTLEGEIFDKTTNRLTGIKSTASLTPTSASGTTEITFTLDASGLENHTLVVYETLKLNGETLTEHKNPNDTAQTIYIPEVRTTLTDKDNKNHVSNADSSVTLNDSVVCSNLIVGRTYTISGKLVYKDSGNDVLDNGNTVKATKTFTAASTTETQVLTFTFNGSALEGKTVVAFEDLLTEKKKVGTHADLTDEDQSVHIPKIRTVALDSETKDHISLGDKSVTIKDTVSYENLIPGKTYTLTGTLMDKATGNAVSGVTTEPVQFKPTSAKGTAVVTFVFNGTNLKNHKAVAYEKLYLGTEVKDANLIGVHEDIDDKDQTVNIPEAATTLLDSETKDHIAFGDKSVTLIDTVAYKNLLVGKEYVAKGTLMNQKTGEPVKVNGEDVTAETTFTAAAENGTVEVKFVFNGKDLPGETVVAFETIEYKNVPVAIHANINDKAQTVPIPKIRTTAAISDDNHVFTDTINYENLLPDRKYVFRGWLVDTATGTKIPGSDGMVELTATETNINGSVQMEMDTAKYDEMYGHSMTAFEELYVIEKINGEDKEIKVAEHKDRSGDASTNPQTIEIYQDLRIQKNVTGNLGDLTKIFEYTVEFTDLVPNATYTVEGDDAKTFKAGTDGKATLELKIADDQEAVVKQLPKSATYVVTEAASDHVAQFKMFSEDMADKGAKIVTEEANNGDEAAKILATAKETVDLFDGTIVVVWENNRDLATLTGVKTYLSIWAAALALVLAGLLMVLARRRRYASEE